jgi:hypothetical protein
MNILDLQIQDGIAPEHASNGEYHSPCPFCAGTDRFSSWPDRQNSNGRYMGGRFVCRGCGASGDAVNYLQKRRGLTFHQAVKYLGVDAGPMPERTIKRSWTPEPPKEAPPAVWQDKSETFTLTCQRQLQGNTGALKWLNDERGLSLKTITDSRLGWNAKDVFLDRESWGLPSEISTKTGQQKKLWIAQGLVIPFCLDAVVLRIRIRRSEPPEKGSRYVVVSGSSMGPMVLWQDQDAVVIVESELDCLLISQECGDLVGVIALGSAAMKPDSELHRRLMAAKRVLVSLDSDPAGAKAVAFWRQYPGFKRWMAVRGKDATEQMRAGVPVRLWVEAGLEGGI